MNPDKQLADRKAATPTDIRPEVPLAGRQSV